MKCVCAQTRPRFILSSERVLGGMEFEPMLTPREKSPLPENSPEEDRTRDAALRRTASPNTTNELFRPPVDYQLPYPPLSNMSCITYERGKEQTTFPLANQLDGLLIFPINRKQHGQSKGVPFAKVLRIMFALHNNNNNNERISRAHFHVKHAQLR